ncbi:UNVERIFIED_CONTAM: protein SRG1 [Sesamum calycinum]|uniref:Protein SRG1 n=1 Tax=Sesamum calycinum TaxID=2727403 RepID=A0AAW2LUM3_9LAMI
MAPDPIKIPRIGGLDIVIKDHLVLDRTISSRIEFSSRMSFSEDRIIGEGKEKELLKVLTPQEIRVDNQPVVGRYEGMLEIAGHEILVAGVAGRENGSMTLGLSFLKDHNPWGRKCNGRDFSQKVLILNTGIREAKIMIGGAFGTSWFRVKTPPIYFHDTGADILLDTGFAKRKHLTGNRDSSIVIASTRNLRKIKNLKEAMQELKTMDISEESKLSLENVKRLIQRNFSENPLAWWDRNKIEATLKIKEECIFIKDLAKYIKDFTPLLKEIESAKWKCEEIHMQRVRELKQIAIRTTMVASTSLWNDLQEPIRKASSSEMTNELRKHDHKHALRVQDSRPVAADSSTACTRPSPDSGVTATNESQRVQIYDDSSQPSASGVKEEEISLRPMTDTSKANTNDYLLLLLLLGRVWMMEGSKPQEVREWYEFGALASVHTMTPSFPEISKLPEWISGARPDMVAFNRIKAASEEAPLVSTISEDDISTRRAWGLWVCLTEIDKVKYPFKIFSNKVNGSFLLNSMIGKNTEFAENMFEKKRMLVWENKLPATRNQVPANHQLRLCGCRKSVKSKTWNTRNQSGQTKIINHGAEEAIPKMKAAVIDFYDLPLSEKNKYAMPPDYFEGYSQDNKVGERKRDWYDILWLLTMPPHSRNTKYWPLTVPGFKESVEEYATQVQRVTYEILGNLSLLMGVETDVLKELHGEVKQGTRLNYYPACARPDLVFALSPHHDYTSISFVLQEDDITALQIKHKEMWVPVKPIPNAISVLVGDVLESWSNGKYKGLEHRVVANVEKPRISVISFVIPSDEAELNPLKTMVDDDHPPIYKNGVKYIDYLLYANTKETDEDNTSTISSTSKERSE